MDGARAQRIALIPSAEGRPWARAQALQGWRRRSELLRSQRRAFRPTNTTGSWNDAATRPVYAPIPQPRDGSAAAGGQILKQLRSEAVDQHGDEDDDGGDQWIERDPPEGSPGR